MGVDELLAVIFNFWTGLAVLIIILVKSSVKFVPQNRAFVVERFGKYNKTMVAGLNLLFPFIDKVAYDQSLKEHAFDVPSQSAITKDNISLVVDGVLYLKLLEQSLYSGPILLANCFREITKPNYVGWPVSLLRPLRSHRGCVDLSGCPLAIRSTYGPFPMPAFIAKNTEPHRLRPRN